MIIWRRDEVEADGVPGAFLLDEFDDLGADALIAVFRQNKKFVDGDDIAPVFVGPKGNKDEIADDLVFLLYEVDATFVWGAIKFCEGFLTAVGRKR